MFNTEVKESVIAVKKVPSWQEVKRVEGLASYIIFYPS